MGCFCSSVALATSANLIAPYRVSLIECHDVLERAASSRSTEVPSARDLHWHDVDDESYLLRDVRRLKALSADEWALERAEVVKVLLVLFFPREIHRAVEGFRSRSEEMLFADHLLKHRDDILSDDEKLHRLVEARVERLRQGEDSDAEGEHYDVAFFDEVDRLFERLMIMDAVRDNPRLETYLRDWVARKIPRITKQTVVASLIVAAFVHSFVCGLKYSRYPLKEIPLYCSIGEALFRTLNLRAKSGA